MSQKRPLDDQVTEGGEQIFESQKIEDRSSTFVALYTPSVTTPPKQLQSHPSIADASHRILAWRKPGRQHTLPIVGSANDKKRVLYDSGHDDDGESYAGKKLENLLWNLDVAGTVVVARWYGGVMLGPVRFEHIVSVAREAVKEWKKEGEERMKRRKMAEDQEREKLRLVGVLKERDRSIEVLRALLAEKKGEKERGEGEGHVTRIDYGNMVLETLKRLERARDSTIKWILAQIDKAEEEEQRTKHENEDDTATPRKSNTPSDETAPPQGEPSKAETSKTVNTNNHATQTPHDEGTFGQPS